MSLPPLAGASQHKGKGEGSGGQAEGSGRKAGYIGGAQQTPDESWGISFKMIGQVRIYSVFVFITVDTLGHRSFLWFCVCPVEPRVSVPP